MTATEPRLVLRALPYPPPRPVTRPSDPDIALWERACQRARRDTRLIPGLAEVSEKIGPCATNGDIAVYFATRIAPDSRGEPMARLTESAGRRIESAFEPLVRHAHALLDDVESALRSADPLLDLAPDAIQRSMRRVVDGVPCIGFTTIRRTACLDFEFSIWISVEHGHAVRVDFRGVNLGDRESLERISSVYGLRRYQLDAAGRFLLIDQTDRLTFIAASPDLPPTGYAERTSAYSDHWEQPAED